MWPFKKMIYMLSNPTEESIPLGYCVNWVADNESNIKMSTQGYVDFTDMLAGRSIHTGASTGHITGYVIAGLAPLTCDIPMSFTSSRATWITDTLPVVTDKVLTSLIYTVNIIFTDASEFDIIDEQTNAIVEPDPQITSAYNSCII